MAKVAEPVQAQRLREGRAASDTIQLSVGERKALANEAVTRSSTESSKVVPVEGAHLSLAEGRP
eukprot:739170-Alexandrium_andersonii.AAC.1